MKRAAVAALLVLTLTSAASAGDVLDVVAFGTSLTAKGNWQEQLGAALAECRNGPVAVHTVAQPGATSDWAVEHLDEVIRLEPEVVLVEFSVNDASLVHGVGVDRSLANTREILDRLDAAHVQPVLMTMNPASGLRWLSRPFLADYYELYRRLARERGLLLADLAPRWAGRPAEDIPDGLHPTPEAAIEVLVPVLLELLCPAR